MIGLLVASLGFAVSSVFTVHRPGAAWSFVDPAGRSFWSYGVDCVDTGTSRTSFKKSNPSYASYRLFVSNSEWVDDTLSRLKSWGFNSTGAWSNDDLFRQYAGKDRLAYFVCLHLGAWDQAPWHDLFDSAMEHWVNVAAQKQIPPIANDPKLVGYFTDNELGWWDETLFLSYLGMKPTAPGHRKLIGTLRSFYQGSFEHLKLDWFVNGTSFETIRSLHQRPGRNGRKAVDAWTQVLGERYYSLMRDTIRRYDKRHLILGDRYCQYYTLPIVRAASKYVDVVSTNYGADWNDGSIAPFFLRTLNSITKKPAIVTEFYLAATENRSGNKNSGSAFPVVETQQERAAAYTKYVRALASLPYVVGAHWFQFTDEPAHGRGDGEDFDFGFLDVEGRPYDEMVRASESLDLSKLRSEAKDRLPSTNLTVPTVTGDPMTGLKQWPRQEGVLPTSEGTPFGDAFVAQDAGNLYLGLYAMDYMDEGVYADGHVPEVDRARWQIRLNGLSKPIDIRFGGKGRKASTSMPGIDIKESGGLKYTVMIRVPKAMIRKSGPVEFGSSLDSHGRGEHMEWKATLTGVKR
ncbi:MAG: hypothetical protein P4L46_02270 [Fimbriimonas sp.]|nr:hypothetical protein [Fimbriimonas sp.]